MKLPRVFRELTQWFNNSPEELLEKAYRASLTIKLIEDQYFAGEQFNPNSRAYSQQVIKYFQEEIEQNLAFANTKLNQFKKSRSYLRWSHQNFPRNQFFKNTSKILEKLNFVEDILSRYNHLYQTELESEDRERPPVDLSYEEQLNNPSSQQPTKRDSSEQSQSTQTISGQTSVLPRSLLRTLNRIKREIDPNSSEAEEEVVQTFRTSRDKTAISIRFLLLLIIIPLLTHQISKNFVITPIIKNNFMHEEQQELFINRDIQEEALHELNQFEEKLHFKKRLGVIDISEEEIEERVDDKVQEIAEHYRHRGANALSNIFADLLSVLVFGLVIYYSQEQIAVLKSFIDELVYGLSDSAKAFLIILSTDMFVGYHSPHGWEIILEEIGRHFGLPESREFNFLFIATFPVILDTVLKYWIFRYLNRISPSAVATYRNMNE